MKGLVPLFHDFPRSLARSLRPHWISSGQKWRLAATRGTTHVPLEGPNSDPWRHRFSSQTHKVASANIWGKKKGTYLKIKRQLQVRTLIQLQKPIFTNVTSNWISQFLKRLTIEMIQWTHMDSLRTRNSTPRWEMKNIIHTKNLYSNVHGVTAKKETTQTSISWWLNKTWHIHTRHYSDEVPAHVATRRNLENSLQSEREQAGKAVYCSVPCVLNSQKSQTHRNRKRTSDC